MAHIAIVGCDHCGSTALARLLATGPDVWCGGELHWLLDTAPGATWRMNAGWEAHRGCRVHGAACPVLTPDFLARTDLDPTTLYAELLARSGKSVLVSSDKYPINFRRFMTSSPDSLGVVLFKDPKAAYLSQVVTNRLLQDTAVQVYLDLYREALAWAPAFFPRLVWMDFGDLLAQPVAELSRLQVQLEVDLRLTGALAADYCHIGGNEPAHRHTELLHPGAAAQRVQQAEQDWPGFFAPLYDSRESFDLYQELRAKVWR